MDFGFTNTEWFFGTMIMDKLNEIYGFQVVVNNLGNFAMGAVLTLEITFFSILIGFTIKICMTITMVSNFMPSFYHLFQ
jgi:ABC-type amino acid transport system permease subunit